MSEEFELPPELSEFEERLRATALPLSELNRDVLMFRAGAASVRHPRSVSEGSADSREGLTIQPIITPVPADPVGRVWPWQVATISLAALAGVLAVMLAQITGEHQPIDWRLAQSTITTPNNVPNRDSPISNGDLMPDPISSSPKLNAGFLADLFPTRRFNRLNLLLDPGRQFSEHSIESSSNVSFTSTPATAKSQSELMRELMPEMDRPVRAPFFDWFARDKGPSL